MLLALLMVTLVISGIFAQGRKPQQAEEPTDVRAGVLTEREKKHSKLYDRYATGRRLDAPAAGEGQEPEVYVEPPIAVVSDQPSADAYADFLRGLTCESDAVLLVRVGDKTSQLTEGRDFIFTDYGVTVEQILKNDPSDPVAPQARLVVTRPGGAVKVNGRVARATDASFQRLEAGREYLLFLKRVPETGAYEALRKGSFLKADDFIVKLTEEPLPGGNGARSFSEASYVVQAGCSQPERRQ
jgi:hypothetical protein